MNTYKLSFYKRLFFVLFTATCFFQLISCNKSVDVEQVTPPAGVMDFTPIIGPKNTIININGDQFPDKGSIAVTVNGKVASVISSTSTNIQAKVASGTGSGPIKVSFSGKSFNGPDFTYINSSFEVTSITNGIQGYLDGPVATAYYEDIEGIVIDANNNLYNAQYGSGADKVRKLNLNTMVVSTLNNAVGGGAEFISVDVSGNVYIADEDNNLIKKITPTGSISTIASTTFAIQGIKVGTSGNIYVSGSTTIAKFNPAGSLLWSIESHGSGNVDGDTSLAEFNLNGNIEVDPTEKFIYVLGSQAATLSSQIKLLSIVDKTITTIAGTGNRGLVNGSALSARFGFIYSVLLDKDGGLYIADATNNVIRYLKDDNVRTVIGSSQGDLDGNGSNVKLNFPQGLAFDTFGNLYISDYSNGKIKKVIIN